MCMKFCYKNTPRPGIEPGPPGWKPGILTPRPSGTDSLFSIPFYIPRKFELKCFLECILYSRLPYWDKFSTEYRPDEYVKEYLSLGQIFLHKCWYISSCKCYFKIAVCYQNLVDFHRNEFCSSPLLYFSQRHILQINASMKHWICDRKSPWMNITKMLKPVILK